MPRRVHYGAVTVSMVGPSWLNRYDNNEHIRMDSDRQPNSQGAGLRRQCDSKSQRTCAVSLEDRGPADIA
jgi:hypothetical protein